jgi:hypothetical protein
MYFWAIGAGVRVNIGIGLRTTTAEIYGGDGSCAKDGNNNGCYDRHALSIPLSGDWKLYSFTWNQLRQAGWGTKAAFDAKITTQIVFGATSNDAAATSIDYSIDNVGFFKGTPPSDPPMAQ